MVHNHATCLHHLSSIENLGGEWFSVYVWGHDEATLLSYTQLETVPEKTLGIVTTILFIFQLIISFSSTVNREDLAQGFTEQNGFYQSSSVSPSRATVQMSEALTLDPLEQLRHPLFKSMRGTEGSSVLWDALLQPQERNQRGLRRSIRSAFLYFNPSVNLLTCTFHLDSCEPHHHCQCRVRKQPTAMPPVYLFTFSVWFWFFVGEQARVTSISSWPFQQYTLPVSNCPALNFLDSTETAGRPAFSSDSLPLLLLPSMMGSALFLRFIHPKFQETSHFLSSSYSKPDRLTFPSCLQIRAFSWLLHIPFWFCHYSLSLFQSGSLIWLFLLCSKWKTLISRLLL